MSRLAIITGASSGIGRSFAFLCARGGYDLHLVARDKDNLETVKKEIKAEYETEITIQAIDLSQKGATAEVFDRVRKRRKEVEILVNSAGFGDMTLFTKARWTKLQAMMDLNMTALVHLSHLFAPIMVKNHSGRILNVASTAAFIPGPRMAVYHATKSFVLSLSEALAEELKDKGVTVTALCPGPTDTNFAKQAHADKLSIFKSKLPSADEVADFGYKAMMDGKRVAIHGLQNRLQAEIPRFAPRKAVSLIVNQIYGRRKEKS